MITFHPAARKTLNGFVPMVTLRADKGRMVGSKLSQSYVYVTAAEAFDHAMNAARRVVALHSATMQVKA
jgi:hypothetical protein